MDRIDRKDVEREESLQSAVPKDHYDSISTYICRQHSHFSAVEYSHCEAIVHEGNRLWTDGD